MKVILTEQITSFRNKMIYNCITGEYKQYLREFSEVSLPNKIIIKQEKAAELAGWQT